MLLTVARVAGLALAAGPFRRPPGEQVYPPCPRLLDLLLCSSAEQNMRRTRERWVQCTRMRGCVQASDH